MLDFLKTKARSRKAKLYQTTEDSASSPLLGDRYSADSDSEEHDTCNIVYWVFFLYGIAMLLPWNVFITASEYFTKRFSGTIYEEKFQNYFSTYFTAMNLCMFAWILYRQNKGRRFQSTAFHVDVMLPVLLNALVFGVMSVTVQTGLEGTHYFWLTMVLLVLTGATTSFFQVAVFAVASRFTPKYMQAVMSGQGLAGVAVALSSILSTLTQSAGEAPDEAATRRAALMYFMAALTVTLAALVGRFVLARQPFYYRQSKLAEFSEEEVVVAATDGGIPAETTSSSLLCVLQKSLGLIFAVCYAFALTLMVFPSITALIKSVTRHDTSQPNMPQSAEEEHNRFLDDDIFVAVHFLLFNLGDWVGRTLPIAKCLQIFDAKVLVVMAFARTAFVPAFLLCNIVVSTERHLPVLIGSDLGYFILIWLFAMTNGYVSSLAMMAAPQQETIRPHEKALVGSVMSFSLVVGLTLGGSLSFPLRAMV